MLPARTATRILLAAACIALPASSSAATLTWNGGAGGWGDAAAWSGLTWTAGDDAILAGTSAAAVTVAGTQSLASLTFNQTMSVTGGTLGFTGSAAVNVGSGFTGTIGSAITGTGFTKTGNGTLIVDGSASLGGSANTIAVNAGTLTFNQGGMAFDNSGGWGGGAAVTVASGATVRLANNFNAGHNRAFTINGGTLNVTSGVAADSSQYLNNLTLNSGAQVTGNALRMGYHGNATVTVGGSSASTISSQIALFRNSTFGLTFAVADATSSSAVDLLVSGVIQDASGFAGTPVSKTGAGTLRLSGANTFSGGLTVSAGTLELGASAGFGGNVSSVGSGALTVASGATATTTANFGISGITNNTNTRTVNVAGTLNLFGSEYIRTLNLTGGTVNATTASGEFLRVSGAGMSLNSLAAATSSTLTGKIDMTFASLTLDVADGAAANDLVISGTITQNTGGGSGSKTLAKSGAGTLLLSGANTFDGVVSVNAGTIKIGNKNALGAFVANRPVSQVVVASGAAVDFNGIVDATYGYTISGSGVGGTGALTNSGSIITVNAAQASNITLSADASIGGAGSWALLTNGFGVTALDLAGRTLTKVGTNTVSLVNTTFTAGNLRISSGTIALSAGGGGTAPNNSMGSVALTVDDVAGATFSNASNYAITLGSLAGGGSTGGTVALGSGSLSVGGLGTSTAYAGAITGATASLTKTGNGTLTLSGNNTYGGGTTLSAGGLAVGSNTALGSGAVSVGSAGGIRSTDTTARSLANNLSFSANATLGDATNNGALTFGGTVALGASRTLTTASDVTFSGIVSGGSLTKLGNGRLTLGGVAHTFNGDLTVSAGSLGLASGASLATSRIIMGDGTSLVAAAGFTLGAGKQLQLGASGAGSVTMSGNFTLGGGSLALDVGSVASDLLAVTGDLNLASGTLAFTPVGGTYSEGTYTLATYTGSLTGLGTVSTSGLVSSSSTSRTSFSLSSAVANQVNLVVSGSSASMVWTGAVDGVWDSGLSGTANWSANGSVASGASDRFYDLDAATFGDAGANRSIAIGSALTVGSMTFSNTSGNTYTLSGNGSLGGLASIAKSGSGQVDLDVAYTGTGGIAVSNGTLRLLNAGIAPGAGAAVTVSGGRLVVASGVTLGSAPVTVSGGTLSVVESASLGSGLVTLNGGALELAANGTYAKSLTVGASGATLAAIASGTTTLSSALAVDGALTLSAVDGASLVASGALTGSSAVTKSGAGSATLSSASGFTGGLTVSQGALTVSSTLGSSGSHAGAIVANGTLNLTSSSNQTLSGSLSGSGQIAKSGGGTLTLSSTDAAGFTGGFSVTNSTLSLANSTAAGNATITLSNATLSRNVGNTTVANNLVIGAGGATIAGRQPIDSYTAFTGSLSGSADLRVDGLVQLSGNASGFTGKVVIADATSYLRLATSSASSFSAANILEFAAGSLRVDGHATGVTYTVGGLVSAQGVGNIFPTNDAGGNNATLVLDVAAGATRTYGGSFDRNNVTNFRLQKAGEGTQVLNRASGFGAWGAGVAGLNRVLVTGGLLEIAAGSMTFETAGFFGTSQAFEVSNGATLRVSQAWNLAAGNSVALSAGTLDVTNGENYLNTVSLAAGSTLSGGLLLANTGNAALTSTGDATNTISANLTLVNNATPRTATFNVADGAQADDLVVSGTISDYAGLGGTALAKTNTGTMVLSGANTFSGNLSVGAGALRVTGTLGGGSYAGAIANSGILAFQSDSNQTLSGLISGGGGLAKSGSGILTITGANSGFSGNVSILGGTLVIGDLLSLGTGVITLSGGTLDLGGLAIANTINFAGGNLTNAAPSAPPIAISGNVSAETINNLPGNQVSIGAGATVDLSGVTKAVVVTGNATLQNLASFTGSLAVAGALDLSSPANRPGAGATIELRTGGSLNLGSTTPFAGDITFKGGSVTGSFAGNLNVAAGDDPVSLAGVSTTGGTVVVATGASVNLASFSGSLRLTGNGSIAAGLDTFAGELELASGAALNLTASEAPNATITVSSGGVLRGVGDAGDTTITSGGTLAPGNSPGMPTLASLTLANNSSLDMELLNSYGGLVPLTRGVDHDSLSVTGALSLSGVTTLNLISLNSNNGGLAGPLQDFDDTMTYSLDLISYGSITNYEGSISQFFSLVLTNFTYGDGLVADPAFFSLVDLRNGDGSGVIQLQYAPIPEPSTYGLILGGLALAGAAVRRRRKNSR